MSTPLKQAHLDELLKALVCVWLGAGCPATGVPWQAVEQHTSFCEKFEEDVIKSYFEDVAFGQILIVEGASPDFFLPTGRAIMMVLP